MANKSTKQQETVVAARAKADQELKLISLSTQETITAITISIRLSANQSTNQRILLLK